LQTRTVLLGLLYPFDSEPDSNSLDVLLNRLRRKLAGADVEIETVRGKGLILRVA
jgi:DNA-binding response OmpR family regulator